mgnify:CR=1 FL=1
MSEFDFSPRVNPLQGISLDQMVAAQQAPLTTVAQSIPGMLQALQARKQRAMQMQAMAAMQQPGISEGTASLSPEQLMIWYPDLKEKIFQYGAGMAGQRKQEHEKRQADIDWTKRRGMSGANFLNPKEIAAIRQQHPGMEDVELEGVDRRLVTHLLPTTFLHAESGRTVQAPKGTKVVEAPAAREAAATLSKLNSFDSAFKEYLALVAKSPSGRYTGNLAVFVNKNSPFFPEIRTAKSIEGVLAPMAARVIGGDVGNLNQQEQVQARQAIEMLGRTPEEQRQGARIMLGLIASKRQEMQRLQVPGMFREGGGGNGGGGNTVRIQDSQGQQHEIPRAKLPLAKKRDPRLKVIQ